MVIKLTHVLTKQIVLQARPMRAVRQLVLQPKHRALRLLLVIIWLVTKLLQVLLVRWLRTLTEKQVTCVLRVDTLWGAFIIVQLSQLAEPTHLILTTILKMDVKKGVQLSLQTAHALPAHHQP